MHEMPKNGEVNYLMVNPTSEIEVSFKVYMFQEKGRVNRLLRISQYEWLRTFCIVKGVTTCEIYHIGELVRT